MQINVYLILASLFRNACRAVHSAVLLFDRFTPYI